MTNNRNIDAIGFIGTLLTTIGFFQSNFPKDNPEGAKVQIKAGLGDDNSSALGGGINAVYSFDQNNNYIGRSGGGSMGDGGIVELTIDQSVPGVQSDYISVENGNDATCIAWISVTQFDSTPGGAWTGDVGKNCGLPWYYGNELAGQYPNGSDYRPFCAWLDGDHTHDYPYAALKFRVHAYGNGANDTIKNNCVCSSTIFGRDSGPISGQPAKRGLNAQRKTPKRLQWLVDRLIVSNQTGDRARELCDSDTSYGPDFVGTDGMFCDMDTKALSPLCSTQSVDGCIEVDEEHMAVTKRSMIARRAVNSVHKTYKKVTKW